MKFFVIINHQMVNTLIKVKM